MPPRFYGTLTDPLYVPAVINILSISNANPAVVVTTYDGTTAAANDYIDGLIVRIVVPQYFGMQQINKMKGVITIISPTSFSITIDSTNYDPFLIPTQHPSNLLNAAQVVPLGEKTEILTGSFVNIYQEGV